MSDERKPGRRPPPDEQCVEMLSSGKRCGNWAVWEGRCAQHQGRERENDETRCVK